MAHAGCDWKYIARIERREPTTRHIGDALIRDGLKGLLLRSARSSLLRRHRLLLGIPPLRALRPTNKTAKHEE
jgi:hypothetical protein